jgi:hypothetical protein
MNVNVYDTYVRTVEGDLLHFDILLPAGEGFMAIHFANKWLHSVGKIPKEINQENCRYRHTETATPEIQKQIRVQGYFIIQMEGCPVLAD